MKIAKIALGIFLSIAALPAFSATVTYALGDHLDGALYNAPDTDGPNGPYGLRLDTIDPPAGAGPTFSVGDNLGGNGGVLLLSWDDADLSSGANISGTIYRNDLGGTWTVDYDITGLTSDGNGGWTATGGSGIMTEDSGPGVFTLIGKQDNTGAAFVFADDGHRLGTSDGWVGRGWIQGSGTNDFLVTATYVPVPAAVWLFGSAIGMLGWMRRRRTV